MTRKGESERVEVLLALILVELMKEANKDAKIKKLRVAGFSNVEIADLLDMTANAVALVYSRSQGKSSGRKKLGK